MQTITNGLKKAEENSEKIVKAVANTTQTAFVGSSKQKRRKRIYIPSYIRANGYIVKGHYRHMTEDKATRSEAAAKGWEKRRMRLKA